MKNNINILMVDDHEAILEGYKTILRSKTDYKMNITFANDCDQAVQKIKTSKNENPYDVIFLDIQLPESSDGKYISGEDIALLIHKELPKAKVIILTMYNEAHRLLNIIKNTPHNAVLVKSEVNSKTIAEALETVVTGSNYYSKTVQTVKFQIIEYNEELDDLDRRILFYLNKGINTKDLPRCVDLSLSSIEKRKKNIKQIFNVSKNSELLVEAKKRGLL